MKTDISLIYLMNKNNKIGSWPLFWIVKNNNIVITNGKIGTMTLKSICDYSCHDKILTGNELITMVKEKGFNLHFVIREPKSRFDSGIFEEWCYNLDYKFNFLNTDSIDAKSFTEYRLSILNSASKYSQYHTGNWLKGILEIMSLLPEKFYKIWLLDELYLLLESLGVDKTIKLHETKSIDGSAPLDIYNKFANAYHQLPKSTVKKINRYLTDEKILYDELVSIDKKLSRGFVILAQNTKDIDYVKCAAALAKSIKQFMPHESVTLVTMNLIISDYAKYFDHIVELPYGDLDEDNNWKLINDWQVYEASPYKYTIKLEADIYIPRDISHWWDVLTGRDLVVSTTIRNYKQDISDVRVYRRFIDDNKLPDCYNAITYFKKSSIAEKFFAIVRDVFEHWEQYRAILKCKTDEIVTTDWAYAIASHILGVENTTLPAFTDMSMIHMKQFVNGTYTEDWTDTFVYEVLPDQIRVQTVPQMYPFHYHKKSFADKLLN